MVLSTPAGPINTSNLSALTTYVNSLQSEIDQLKKEITKNATHYNDLLELRNSNYTAAITNSTTLTEELVKAKSELEAANLQIQSLEEEVENKQKAIKESQQFETEREKRFEERLQKEMAEVHEKLREANDTIHQLEGQLETSKTSYEKWKLKFAEALRANKIMAENEKVYKEAISDLKSKIAERDKQLKLMFGGMKSGRT